MSVIQSGSCGFLELLGVSSLSVLSESQDDCGRGTTDTSGNCRKKAGQQQLGHDEDSSQQPRGEPSCNRPDADPDAPLPPVRTHQAHDDQPHTRSNTSDETTRESTEHDAHQKKERALTGQAVIYHCDHHEGQAPQHRTGQQGLPEDTSSAARSRPFKSPVTRVHVTTLRMNQRSCADMLFRTSTASRPTTRAHRGLVRRSVTERLSETAAPRSYGARGCLDRPVRKRSRGGILGFLRWSQHLMDGVLWRRIRFFSDLICCRCSGQGCKRVISSPARSSRSVPAGGPGNGS